MRLVFLFSSLVIAAVVVAQTQKSSDVAAFVTVDTPVFVLNHVRVIDGTGAAAKEDQAIVIANSKIQSIGPAASAQIPQGAQLLDHSGYTVIPGLVGMHDHLYYTDSIAVEVVDGKVGEPGLFIAEIPYTAPRLYLAAGVTTMRTTGSLEPYTDLKVKSRIDANLMPGPAIDATAPYLEGAPTRFAQMHELAGPEDAKRMVDYWATEGMTSYKAYMNITREELAVAIHQAHAHKLKLTGHLCSVTWPEAVALGIDDLEHGPVFTDTEFVRLPIRDEFGIGKDGSMLQIIYSQSYRFRPGHRAQMPFQFQLVSMCLLDRDPQLFPRDVHVRFVRCHAFRRPVLHHPFRIVGSGQFMHLRKSCRRTFQVGCSRIDARSRHQVSVDPPLHFQVG